jgi:hypothetical protein
VRRLALADLTNDDLQAMLDENETLFVEHKQAFGGESFQIAKAMCSFANTLGGWVLVGVTNGTPNAGTPGGWEPLSANSITDRARQALAANRVDPIPPFAATVKEYGDPPRPIGVIRVYESTDTPHVIGNGQVFVRSVAEDRDLGRRYRAGGVETQAALLSLAERGRSGAEQARAKLDLQVAPLVPLKLGLAQFGTVRAANGVIALRAVPVTPGRLPDWAVSQSGYDALRETARSLARGGEPAPEPEPGDMNASGLRVRAGSDNLLPPDVLPARDGVAIVAADAAGVVGASMQMGIWTPARETTRLTLNGIRNHFFMPLLEAVTSLLMAAEAFGRVLLELRIGSLEQVVTLDDTGGFKQIPPDLPLGAELTLPIDPDGDQLAAAADQWRSDAGRAAGYVTLRP